MKKLIIISFLLLSNIIFSQEKKITLESNFESIEISIDSLEEIDTIKWEDFKDIFKENKPESIISLKITLKNVKKENIITSFSIGVNGKSEEIDSLVEQLKKGILKIKEVAIKLNEKNKQ
jgi:hypothetical protein